MDNQPAAERRTEKLDLRVSPSAKTKLQAAALVAQRSVSDFVMESALAKAEETLAERRVFGLDPEKWATLQTALDAPVRRLPRLRALLDQPGLTAERPDERIDAAAGTVPSDLDAG